MINPNIKNIMLQYKDTFEKEIGFENYQIIIRDGFKDRSELRKIMNIISSNKLAVATAQEEK